MYGVLWYWLCVAILRYLFRWQWAPALTVALPLALLALVLGTHLLTRAGLD